MPEGGNIPPDPNNKSALQQPPHVTRMIDEAAALEEKLTKLAAFTESDAFEGLSAIDQRLLYAQEGAMNAYLQVLQIRIARAD